MDKRKDIDIERTLTYEELSAATGLKVSFLKKAKNQYELPHYKIGALVRFRLSEVEVWLKGRRTG